MSKTTSEQTTTAHGEVTYETVECDSCGQSVKKDDAYVVLIGDRTKSPWHIEGKRAELHACEHCVEEPLRWMVRDAVSIVDRPSAEAAAWATILIIALLLLLMLLGELTGVIG